MITGYSVQFNWCSNRFEGTIRDKYQGVKLSPDNSYIPIDYYLIQDKVGKLYHIPCSDIIKIL